MLVRSFAVLSGLGLLGVAGCGTSASPTPEPAGHTVQFEMKTSIDAGVEDERCKFVTLTEDLWVHQEVVHYTPGSHHFILWSTTYTSIPTEDNAGNKVDTSDVFQCPGGPPNGWNVDRNVGGSQAPNSPTILGELPDNVALHIPKGSVLMMDLHILNSSAATLPVTVQIDLNAIPAEKATVEAGIYFFYNPFIVLPPAASAHARMSCPVTSDLNLTTAQTHMHKWGLGGVANLEDGKGKVIEQLYTSSTWSDPAVTAWSQPAKAVKAGQQIDYQCNYQNDGAQPIVQGLSAVKNEMCVLSGAYYPRDQKFETCGTTGKLQDQGSAATFIGSGAATCGETLLCMQNAGMKAEAFYSCVIDSCPGAATPMTKFLDCAFTAPDGADVTKVCAPQISTCLAASCTAG